MFGFVVAVVVVLSLFIHFCYGRGLYGRCGIGNKTEGCYYLILINQIKTIGFFFVSSCRVSSWAYGNIWLAKWSLVYLKIIIIVTSISTCNSRLLRYAPNEKKKKNKKWIHIDDEHNFIGFIYFLAFENIQQLTLLFSLAKSNLSNTFVLFHLQLVTQSDSHHVPKCIQAPNYKYNERTYYWYKYNSMQHILVYMRVVALDYGTVYVYVSVQKPTG